MLEQVREDRTGFLEILRKRRLGPEMEGMESRESGRSKTKEGSKLKGFQWEFRKEESWRKRVTACSMFKCAILSPSYFSQMPSY